MNSNRTAWTSYGSTSLFVLLWSGGAIFAKVGLAHASAFAFLTLRFALASGVLLMLGALRRDWLPLPGTRLRVAITGLLLIGSYTICYLLALDHGITPGVLATVLGTQPILTLVLLERRFSGARLGGLMLALLGLILVVWQSIATQGSAPHVPFSGMLFALASLASMTAGAILQKAVQQAPIQVLPLQYAVSLLLCLCFVPFKPFEFELSSGFLIPLIWMGLLISVVAQLLLYRMIQRGNLVNVTSLFYLVPVGTAALDYVFLGNPLSRLSALGMAVILLGLMLVFSKR
ncbi:MAG TPA: DMT family transporter [Povalibacter sp.]|nr:DMT family transporter [Povalibacter sp.]